LAALTISTANPGQEERVMTASRSWWLLSDRLLRGIMHQLSNRAYALLTVATELEEAGTAETVALLRSEAARLESAVRLLGLLPAAESHTAESVDPAKLLHDVVALYELRAGARVPRCRVNVEDGVPHTRADVSRLARVLLLACEFAAGEELAVSIDASRDGASLSIVVRQDADSSPMCAPHQLDELAALAAPDDGMVEAGDDGRIQLRYPASYSGG